MSGPKVLLIDIETAPILAYVWSLWKQNIGLNQIKEEWHILSFAAKWLGEKEVLYYDQAGRKDKRRDKVLLNKIWRLLDEADVIITQNGKKFDIKKINARFILHGMAPPSSFKHIDTLQIAKKHFGFTSNKLEWMTDKICKKYKKLKHGKYPGFDLWAGCLNDEKAAWREMKKYNINDILSMEELYLAMRPWDNTINPNWYTDSTEVVCSCGSTDFQKRGFFFTPAGKYQRYKCKECGKETRGTDNLFSKEKRASLRRSTQ